jgi:hypothetical protein
MAGYGVDVKPYILRVRALANAEIKTEAMFLRQLWNYTLTLYRDGDETAFLDDMIASIRNQLTRAWNEGADAVGVTAEEYTEQDNASLETIIQKEYDQVISLADAVLNARANLMATPDFRAQFKPRVEMWANRYGDVVNRAKAHFGGRMKLEWVLGETEEHCETCNRLNGIVAWAKEWRQRASIRKVRRTLFWNAAVGAVDAGWKRPTSVKRVTRSERCLILRRRRTCSNFIPLYLWNINPTLKVGFLIGGLCHKRVTC